MTRFGDLEIDQKFYTHKNGLSFLTWKKIGHHQAIVVAVSGNMQKRWLDVVDNFEGLKGVYPI